jgi:plasmid maintenance system antidote protein VapI
MKKLKSIKQLAEAIDRTPNAIYRWLHGERGIPLSYAMKLRKITGVGLEYWHKDKVMENPYFLGIRKYNKKEK